MDKGLIWTNSVGEKIAWCYALDRYVAAQKWISKKHYENNLETYGSYDIPAFAMWVHVLPGQKPKFKRADGRIR